MVAPSRFPWGPGQQEAAGASELQQVQAGMGTWTQFPQME